MPNSKGFPALLTCWEVVICKLQVRSGQSKCKSGASAIIDGCSSVSMERMLSRSLDHKFIA